MNMSLDDIMHMLSKLACDGKYDKNNTLVLSILLRIDSNLNEPETKMLQNLGMTEQCKAMIQRTFENKLFNKNNPGFVQAFLCHYTALAKDDSHATNVGIRWRGDAKVMETALREMYDMVFGFMNLTYDGLQGKDTHDLLEFLAEKCKHDWRNKVRRAMIYEPPSKTKWSDIISTIMSSAIDDDSVVHYSAYSDRFNTDMFGAKMPKYKGDDDEREVFIATVLTGIVEDRVGNMPKHDDDVFLGMIIDNRLIFSAAFLKSIKDVMEEITAARAGVGASS